MAVQDSVPDASAESATIEVPTSHLLRLLADVQPFASSDSTLPMIYGVALEFVGSDLLAVATDRYTLAASRLSVGQEIVQPPRMLSLSDVIELRQAFKPARGSDPMLALDFGCEGLAVYTTATLDGQPTHRRGFPWAPIGTAFPKWRSLVSSGPDERPRTTTAAFNPEYLSKFAAVRRDGETFQVWAGVAAQPWTITIGQRFIGLIMPVRTDESAGMWRPGPINTANPEPAAKPRTRRGAKAAA